MRPLREVNCSEYEEEIALAFEVVLDDLKSQFKNGSALDCSTFSEINLNSAFRDAEISEDFVDKSRIVPFFRNDDFEGWYYFAIL